MFKALLIASVFFASTVVDSTTREAEACGVKIGVGSAKGKRPTSAQSANPSSILVVGSNDQALIRKLRSARHRVEYASSVDKAKGSKYRLVIADGKQVDAARDRFASAQIIKHKDRGTAQMVEMTLARRAVSSQERNAPTLASKTRTPVKTGSEGMDDRGRIPADTGSEAPSDRVALSESRVAATSSTAGEPTRVPVEAGAPKPEPRVKAEPKAEPKTERRVEPKETTKAVKTAKWSREFQFGMNSTNLGAGAERRLKSNALWLEQNPSASVTIEGHTDSVGDEAYNQDLSERRANVARDFLLGLGIDESRITVVGKGELEPAVEPSTSARNRRIVLIKN